MNARCSKGTDCKSVYPKPQPPQNQNDTTYSGSGGAPNGAPFEKLNPDLQVIAIAWPQLPNAVRAGIMAMVKASGGGP